MKTVLRRRLEVAGIIGATLVLAAGVLIATPQIRAALAPASAPTPTATVAPLEAHYEVAPVHPTPTPTPTPEPVVAPPPPVEEPPAAPYYGEPVPWIADPNPNNAEGGYWDTTACASGAGYQAEDGNQYCAP